MVCLLHVPDVRSLFRLGKAHSWELCWGGGSTTTPQALWAVLVSLFSPEHRVSVHSVKVCEVAGELRRPLHHVNHAFSFWLPPWIVTHL